MRLYNELSNKLEIDNETPYCQRAKLNTGTHCNYRCEFCYYFNQLDVVTEFEKIKGRIDYLVACGIKEADLSGGESSIHQSWFDILDYCVSKRLRVSCLSNGSRFADLDFITKSKEHGLEEILFSLHGYDEESHNKMVGVKAGWRKMIKAIENANSVGIKVRINCTVTKDNYREIDGAFIELLKQYDIAQLNFLTLNYWDDASSQPVLDYKLSTDAVKRAIDKIDFIPDIRVRYTPYCYMKGYEHHVYGYYQHIYDLSDWNIAVYDERVAPEDYVGNELPALYEAAKRQRLDTYKKNKECLDCKHYYICDGYEKTFEHLDVYPEEGEKLVTPTFYLKEIK